MEGDLDAVVSDMFTYHRWNQEKIRKGDLVREALEFACKCIMLNVPDSADRDSAIRKLRECRMDCNSAITHNGKY